MQKSITAFQLLLSFVLCMLIQAGYSQERHYNYQVEVNYQLHWQPDSTNSQKINKEFMTLLIGKEQSLFCARQFLVMDSAITTEAKKGNKWGPPMNFFVQNGTHYSQVIFKTANQVITYDHVLRFVSASVMHYYKEPRNLFDWQILSDTLTIAGYRCQKATVFFGGRKWVAWFAPSIPVSEGPYKFNGLPGLILQISDTQNFWNFSLAGLKNINKAVDMNFLNNKLEPLKSKEEFLLKRRYQLDNQFELQLLRGIRFSNQETAKKQSIINAKNDNNWIELYKGK